MTSTKLLITDTGNAQLTHPSAQPGYAGRCPVVEISGTEGLQPSQVVAAYARCVVLPIMHADLVIPWAMIADRHQGAIVRL